MMLTYFKNLIRQALLHIDHWNNPSLLTRVGDINLPADWEQQLPSPSWNIPKLKKLYETSYIFRIKTLN